MRKLIIIVLLFFLPIQVDAQLFKTKPDDFFQQLNNILPDAGSPPDTAEVGYQAAYTFDANTDELIRISFVLDEDEYNGDSLIVCVSYSASTSHTGTFAFNTDWRTTAIGDSPASVTPTGSMVVAWSPGTGDTAMHFDTSSLVIDSANLADNDMVGLLMYRDADATSDTHTGELILYDMWVKEN